MAVQIASYVYLGKLIVLILISENYVTVKGVKSGWNHTDYNSLIVQLNKFIGTAQYLREHVGMKLSALKAELHQRHFYTASVSFCITVSIIICCILSKTFLFFFFQPKVIKNKTIRKALSSQRETIETKPCFAKYQTLKDTTLQKYKLTNAQTNYTLEDFIRTKTLQRQPQTLQKLPTAD